MNWGRRSLDAWHITRREVAGAYLISTLSDAKLGAVLAIVHRRCPQRCTRLAGISEASAKAMQMAVVTPRDSSLSLLRQELGS